MTGMKVGLFIGQLGMRGTDQFVHQLAEICETILHHQAVIITHSERTPYTYDVTSQSEAKFRSRFFVVFKDANEKLDDIAIRYGLDVCYISKWGIPCNLITYKVPCLVHSIFECATPHGHCYAAISDYMKRKCRANCEVLPFCVELAPPGKDLRKELNIPSEATVFGRHGGFDSFDVPFVHRAVIEVASKQQDVYFVFMNTRPFTRATSNIIFLPGNPELQARSDFVHACDAMVHGRSEGETFGLSCGEFSLADKPVFTTACGDQAHVDILWPYVHVASNQDEFAANLRQFVRGGWQYGAYKRFNRQRVAEKFQQLLDSAIASFSKKTSQASNRIFHCHEQCESIDQK